MIHVQHTKDAENLSLKNFSFHKRSLCLCRGFFLFIVLLFSSCQTAQNITDSQSFYEHQKIPYLPSQINWQKIDNTSFASSFSYINKDYPLRYHCIRIDLTSPELTIVTYPDLDTSFKDSFFSALSAEAFCQKTDCIIALNAAPFELKNFRLKKLSYLSSKRKIVGIHNVQKKQLSPPVERYSAIGFKKDVQGFKGKIFSSQLPDMICDFDFVFGGFFTILKDYEINNSFKKINNSRTALGLSEDGRILFILAVEGENHLQSSGLSYPECAQIMLALGASDALQMDGGGSTSLYINNKNFLSYQPKRKPAVFIGFKDLRTSD